MDEIRPLCPQNGHIQPKVIKSTYTQKLQQRGADPEKKL
jgi:hypothetical protein